MAHQELIDKLREHGFSRQAVLLGSKFGSTYAEALSKAAFMNSDTYSKLGLGDKIAKLLSEIRKRNIAENLYNFVNGIGPNPGSYKPKRVPRKVSLKPLEVIVDTHLDADILRKAAGVEKEIVNIANEISKTIYRSAQQIIETDSNLVFEVYKDSDEYYTHFENGDVEKQKELFRGTLKHNKKILIRGQEMFSLSAYHFARNELLKFGLISGERYPDYQKIDTSTGVKIKINELLDELELILSDSSEFDIALINFRNGALNRERCVTDATEQFEFRTKSNYETHLSEKDISTLVKDDECDTSTDTTKLEGTKDIYASLLSLQHVVREEILGFFENEIQCINNLLMGAQQILSGGPITNPNASKVSILQNHDRFPNMEYSAETLDKLRPLVESLKTKLDDVPDISDLTTTSRMRKRRTHIYEMKELPKDPWDVTFGNDSGCCIFVPEELEKLGNGVFVPLYLTDSGVRLFAVYRRDEEKDSKRKRMGLVVAFDSQVEGKNILACNSLELSRFGISGGKDTIRLITQYVEKWLTSYGRKAKYDGVTLGAHSYNTSVNYSIRDREAVNQEMVFSYEKHPSYSDVFVYVDKEKRVMVANPKSSYWIWRKAE